MTVQGKAQVRWTRPELDRAYMLASVVGLPPRSIALMLRHEYGTDRTASAVRRALERHFNWRTIPRKSPGTDGNLVLLQEYRNQPKRGSP